MNLHDFCHNFLTCAFSNRRLDNFFWFHDSGLKDWGGGKEGLQLPPPNVHPSIPDCLEAHPWKQDQDQYVGKSQSKWCCLCEDRNLQGRNYLSLWPPPGGIWITGWGACDIMASAVAMILWRLGRARRAEKYSVDRGPTCRELWVLPLLGDP